MQIQELQRFYGNIPQCGALARLLEKRTRVISLQGLLASSAPLLFAGLATRRHANLLFILQDADEAGYFYHDLTQVMGQDDVLFFPSSYRRAVKYGQVDAANEILRTEVLTRLSAVGGGAEAAGRSSYVVTCPEALSQLVVSKGKLDERTLSLSVGQSIEVTKVLEVLRDFGFQLQDYVYEPGQFARRGSIIDVYSYSCEYPFRIDFFDDEIDTIRTFDIQTQLSREKKEQVEIVPQLTMVEEKMPFTSFLPADTVVVVRDLAYVTDTIGRIYSEGFTQQAITERLEDLRGLPIFTIDSAESKDLDDAVSVSRTERGYLLGVHIADVSHYVRGNSELDKEALRRGTSIYYADKVIPMLPKELSNGICSLNPNEDRLAFSCIAQLDKQGHIMSYKFAKSVIRSRVKGVYSEINEMLEGYNSRSNSVKYEQVADQLPVMLELADILKAGRLERGCPELETAEGKLIIDENEIHKNLKSFIDEIEALGTCLLISDTIYDDLNIIQAIPKELNEIKRKFDAVIVNLNKSLSIYNDDRITNFILNTFDRIKEGGLIIIPESTYESLPNGRIGAEALIKTLDLKIELSLHQFPKMLIASKGKE